ncbi:I78 family peptidase inhibitor [Loktanella sp. SALINAS62]|uniref:I78 family peptidase inhibitor n=1 Tax=Loktanella sp. SALINAS62 TaxID=2706124 RepID=UPI002011C9F1|nr:I78 family peptidase inhibitor [Loktanella sp. SALINAS62]
MRALFILPLLAACTIGPAPVPSEDGCGAASYSGLMGQNIAAVTLPADLNARVIGPNDMVTMDYIESRINFETDSFGVITAITCG